MVCLAAQLGGELVGLLADPAGERDGLAVLEDPHPLAVRASGLEVGDPVGAGPADQGPTPEGSGLETSRG